MWYQYNLGLERLLRSAHHPITAGELGKTPANSSQPLCRWREYIISLTSRNEESSAIMHEGPGRDKKHYIPNDCKRATEHHHRASSFDLIRNESAKDYRKETGHVWWDCEKLGLDAAVA